jgi:rubrerythrin
MKANCVHSCKGICSALETAEKQERESIRLYKEYAELCDYPDVREIMTALIRERENGLRLLREKREILTARFNTLDKITESFW